MAVIYLTHPVHGAKVACSDIEADFDEQFGWQRYNPDEQIEPAPDVAAPVARRGRRKKTEELVEPPVPNFLAPQPVEGE
jgi:hypothetical protein